MIIFSYLTEKIRKKRKKENAVLFGVARWFALPVKRQSCGETTFVSRGEDGQYASIPAGTQPHSTQARRACLPPNVHSLDKQFK